MSSYPTYAVSPSPTLWVSVYGGSLGQVSDPGSPPDVTDRRKYSFGSVSSVPSIPEHVSNGTAAHSIQEQDDTEEPNQDKVTDKDKPGWNLSRTDVIILLSLCTSQVWSSMFYSLLAPFFPTEAQNQGASSTETGLIMGIFPLLMFLMSPIYGKYITVIGPKFMYVAGIFGTSTCAILFGVLQWCPKGHMYVIMCFLTRTVEALACSAVGTSNLTIAASRFPSRISTVMGILQACSCVGLMTGPPLGGVLYAAGGFYLPFAVTGGTYMLCGFLSWKILPPIQGEKDGAPTPSRWKLLQIPIIILVGYFMVIAQAAIGLCDVGLAVHISEEKFNLSPALVGLLFLIPSGAVIIMAPINGWMVDKNQANARRILIMGSTIGAIGFLGLGPSPLVRSFIPERVLWIVIVALFISGIGMSVLVITYSEFAAATRERNYPNTIEVKGMISGLYNSLNSLGACLGPTVGGVMVQHLGFSWSSTILAGATLLAGVFLIIYTVFTKCSNICCHSSKEQSNDIAGQSLIQEDGIHSEA